MIVSSLLGTGAARFRFAPSSQRLRWSARCIVGSQQIIDFDLKRLGQPVEHVHGRVHRAPLDPGQVRSGDAGIDGKRFLRQPACRAELSDIPSETRPSIHAPQARGGPGLIHDLYAMNYTAPVEHSGWNQRDSRSMRLIFSVALATFATAFAVSVIPASAQNSNLSRISPGARDIEAQPRTSGATEDPYEAVHRRNREAYDTERQERAKLDAMDSSGADVMRRTREIQAEQQRAFAAADAEAAKPENIMLTAYRHYLVARQCFESRTGFATIYLTPQQVEEAKVRVKGIETKLLKRAPGLDTEERWVAANRLETAANGDISELGFTGRGPVKERIYTEQGRQFCAVAVGWLREVYGFAYPESQTVKKDF